MYQLFIFFMITDPRTTVRGRRAQCAVAVAVAAAAAVLRLRDVVYAPLFALFAVGPAALAIEMAIDARRARTDGVTGPPAAPAPVRTPGPA